MNPKFQEYFNTLNLQHFNAYEFWIKGSQHVDSESPAHNLNTDPPEDLWENIGATAKVLDEFRSLVGSPVIITNAYRSPAYNEKIGGRPRSLHKKFSAVDFVVRSTTSPADWAALLKEMRAAGKFKGGIGIYNSFVHLDTRGTNADWIG